MFSAILKIIPLLDKARAAAMEKNLATRFKKVATGFGKAMSNVMKGSALGIGLSMLASFMNPLDKVEEKIKSILGRGKDTDDIADRFNTTSGNIIQIEQIGKAFNMEASETRDMMSKFADSVENARKELDDLKTGLKKESELSDSTQLLRNFTDEKDLSKSFVDFLASVKSLGNGPGADTFYLESERKKAEERAKSGIELTKEERDKLITDGILVQRTGQELRRQAEEAVFGARLYGGARKFLESDFGAIAKEMKIPSSDKITATTSTLSEMETSRQIIAAREELRDYMASGRVLGSMRNSLPAQLESETARENAKIRGQMGNYQTMKTAQEGLAFIMQGIEKLQEGLTKVIALITRFFQEPPKWMQTVGKFFGVGGPK